MRKGFELMRKILNTDSLLMYFIVSIFLMDMIFRLYAFESPFNFDFVISFIFLLPFAFIFYIICSFFRGTSSHLLSVVLLGLIALIYSSQLIYYQFFRTIFSVYSVGNGAQILEFWKDIAKLFISQSIWILLLYLPVFLLIGFRKEPIIL